MNSEMWWHQYWWIIFWTILVLPIVASIIFALWLRHQDKADLETGSKCWDAFSKIIGAFTVIVTGAMLFGKYIEQQGSLQAERLKQSKRELNLHEASYLHQKLEFDTARCDRMRDLFEEAKRIAAHLAETQPPDPKLVDRFNQLYLAGLIGVEKKGGPVERAMVQFDKKFKNAPDAPTEDLRNLSLKLSTACTIEMNEFEAALLDQHKKISELTK